MFNKKKHNKAKVKPHYKKAGSMTGGEGEGIDNENENINKGPNDDNIEAKDSNDELEDDITKEEVKVIKDAEEEKDNVNNKETNEPEAAKDNSKTECCICGLPIRSIHTSMIHNVTGNLAHFDCILKELINEKKTKLSRFRKIYYIGAGNFAIVKEIYDKKGRLKTYEIIEKIDWQLN